MPSERTFIVEKTVIVQDPNSLSGMANELANKVRGVNYPVKLIIIFHANGIPVGVSQEVSCSSAMALENNIALAFQVLAFDMVRTGLRPNKSNYKAQAVVVSG